MQQDGVSQRVAYALNIVAFPVARCLHSQFYQLPHWLLVDSALPLWSCYRPGNHLCSRTLRGTGLLSSQQCRLGLDMRHTSALPLWSCYSPGNHLCGRTREFNGLLTLSTLLHFLPPAVFSRFFSTTTLVVDQIRHYHFGCAIAPAIIYAAGRRDAPGCLRSRQCRASPCRFEFSYFSFVFIVVHVMIIVVIVF